MADKRVVKIQTRLQELGYSVGSKGVDGRLGDDTSSAIHSALDDLERCKMYKEPEDIEYPEDDYYITEHFRLGEFHSKTGAEVPVEHLDNLKIVCEMLECIRKQIGDKPIFITSGYRTQEENDAIYPMKAKPTVSEHIIMAGVDILSPVGYEKLKEACETLYAKDVVGGLGTGKGIIHVGARHKIPYKNSKARWYYN